MIVIGGIIGAGIFINPYIVAQRLDSPALVLAAWAAGGAIAIAGALTFAELGSLPHAWAAPKTGIWNEYSRELDTMANRIQSLDVTPEQGLRQIQDAMQRSLDRELAVYARRYK